jgi:hypothetical protein
MKSTAVCPKCQSQQIVKVTHVADATALYGSGSDITTNTGHAPVTRRLLAQIADKGSQKTIGEVEAYVCAHCGYFEEYLVNPTQVDWKRVVGATLHKPQGSAPFR